MKSGTPRIDLEDARRRLRELGYLQSPVERFFFRRAVEGRAAVLLPAILLAAVCASLASVAAVAAGESALRDHAPSALVLWAHLAGADLLPCVILGSILGALAGRSRSPTAGAVAAGLASAAVVFGLFAAGVYSLAGRLSASSLLWGSPAVAAALFLGASVRSAFLARAYARSGALPGGRGGGAGAVGVLLLLLAGGALLLPGRDAPAPPPAPPLPSPREAPLVVVAADGLLLDDAGRAAATGRLRSMLERGAAGWWPARRGSPPEIWTDVATGFPADFHGVRALARVRPAGSSTGVRPPVGARWYLQGIGPRLRLVESEPVSAGDRRRLAFWEVAASAGLSAGAIGWWASGPWPGATVLENRDLLRGAAGGLDVDSRAIAALAGLGAMPLATVYLPGPDILREDRDGWRRAVGQVERFLSQQIGRAESGDATVVLLCLDSHPEPGALGRMIVFDRIAARSVRIRPEDVAPSLLARAGVPPARDLPGRPVTSLFAPGTLESSTVATYGARVAPAGARAREVDREYLERLRSLGYLD